MDDSRVRKKGREMLQKKMQSQNNRGMEDGWMYLSLFLHMYLKSGSSCTYNWASNLLGITTFL
jgi:hypothetical protein